MKRRQFVQYSSFTALGALILKLDYSTDLSEKPELLGLLKDEKSVLEIGEAYRKQYVDEDNAFVLRDILKDSVEVHSKEGVTRRIAMDFEEGHTVQVNGWILSITEARQCALYSLIRIH